MLTPRERAHQHDERRLRQVEIRDKRIHHLEAVARIDVNIRPAAGRGHGTVLPRPALDGAAGGRADADHTPAVCLRAVDQIRRLLRNGAVFAVHIVLLDLVLLDRSERAEPDVQRHIADADALGSDPLQKLRREVQTRRGGRR